METKLTREYAEKLAIKDFGLDTTGYLAAAFERGYMKAIEETNAKGLLEALKDLVKFCKDNNVGAELEFAEEQLKKASI